MKLEKKLDEDVKDWTKKSTQSKVQGFCTDHYHRIDGVLGVMRVSLPPTKVNSSSLVYVAFLFVYAHFGRIMGFIVNFSINSYSLTRVFFFFEFLFGNRIRVDCILCLL